MINQYKMKGTGTNHYRLAFSKGRMKIGYSLSLKDYRTSITNAGCSVMSPKNTALVPRRLFTPDLSQALWPLVKSGKSRQPVVCESTGRRR